MDTAGRVDTAGRGHSGTDQYIVAEGSPRETNPGQNTVKKKKNRGCFVCLFLLSLNSVTVTAKLHYFLKYKQSCGRKVVGEPGAGSVAMAYRWVDSVYYTPRSRSSLCTFYDSTI